MKKRIRFVTMCNFEQVLQSNILQEYDLIACDLMGTLINAKYKFINHATSFLHWINQTKKEIIIVTNSHKTARIETLFQPYSNVQIYYHANKPFIEFDSANKKALVIGDQLITDYLFAQHYHYDFLLITPNGKLSVEERKKYKIFKVIDYCFFQILKKKVNQ